MNVYGRTYFYTDFSLGRVITKTGVVNIFIYYIVPRDFLITLLAVLCIVINSIRL